LDKQKLKHHLLLVSYGIILYLVLQNLAGVFSALSFLGSVLASFTIGLILAYLINIPYVWLHRKAFAPLTRKGGKTAKIAKLLAFVLAYIITILIIVFLFWIIIPQLVRSLSLLVQNITFYISEIEHFIQNFSARFGHDNLYQDQLEKVLTTLENRTDVWITQLLENSLNIVVNVSSYVSNWIIGIVFSVYLLYNKETLLRQSRKALKAFFNEKHVARILELSTRANRMFSGFIAGNLLDGMIVGVLCFIGVSIIGTPFPLLISVIIGVTNLIPVIGPFIGAIPSALIILLVDPIKAIIFIALIIGIQQVDGNIIKPRLFGNAVGLPSVWVLLAIVIGGGFFGIMGMIFAVPVFALLYSIFSEIINSRLAGRNIPAEPEEIDNISQAIPQKKPFRKSRRNKKQKDDSSS
jgi:predicted PurR-regulated permease PerM